MDLVFAGTRVDRLRVGLATLSGLGCFPTIPQRECALVPCPNKILLSNARSALTIQIGGTPVWGLRSKSCPLLVRPELAIPIVFNDFFLSIFHSVSSWACCSAPPSFFSVTTILKGNRSLGSDGGLVAHRVQINHFNG